MRRSTRSRAPKMWGLLAWGITLSGLFAETAHAYIDPGTGSMVVQVLGALIAGGIFYFRESLLRARGLFKRRSKPAVVGASSAPDDDVAR